MSHNKYCSHKTAPEYLLAECMYQQHVHTFRSSYICTLNIF